jgi:O-antigen ligase
VWWFQFGEVGTRTTSAFMLECIFIMMLSYFLLARRRSFFKRCIILAGMISVGSGILLTVSRGAWISVLAGSLFLVFAASGKTHKSWPKVALVGGGFLLFLLFVLPADVAQRISQRAVIVGRSADLVRWKVYRETLRVIAGHPFKGVGVGNFMEFVDVRSPYGVQLMHAHNAYLNIWVEQGIVGLLALLVLLFFPLAMSLRLRKAFRDTDREWIITGTAGVLLATALHFFFESFYNFIFFWIIYGFVLSVLLCAKKELQEGTAYPAGLLPTEPLSSGEIDHAS